MVKRVMKMNEERLNEINSLTELTRKQEEERKRLIEEIKRCRSKKNSFLKGLGAFVGIVSQVVDVIKKL